MPALPIINPSDQTDAQAVENRTVLVVDDSRLQRKILSSSLVRWGYEVIEAESGEEALDICLSQRPRIVISDWMMPGMNGIEFCKELKEMMNES